MNQEITLKAFGLGASDVYVNGEFAGSVFPAAGRWGYQTPDRSIGGFNIHPFTQTSKDAAVAAVVASI